MSKFYGKIGFVIPIEKPKGSGIIVEERTEKYYRGDRNRCKRSWEPGDGANANVNLSEEISIVADPFAIANYGCIRYVEYGNFKWAVNSIDIQRPRITLTVGGVYNGG